MTRVTRAMMVLAVCGALLLAGCSGAGVPTAQVQQQPVQSFAANHLAAVVLAKGWLAALRSSPELGNGCEPDGDWEVTEDGYFHVWGTNSDCSTYDFVDRGDAGQGTWVLADGRVVDVSWEILEETWDIIRERIVKQFDDGTRMELVATTDFTDGLVSTFEGALTLADGRTMNFVAVQRANDEETVTLVLPDGSSCAYTMPLTTVGFDEFVADYEGGIDGVYTAPDGREVAFNASGTADRLNTWQVQGDGLSGEFTIGEKFGGDGVITRDGEIVAALNWQASGSATIDLLLAGTAEITPSGAALDFAVDRWIDNAAGMGPMPVY